ncbi:MAG: hypothetical protein QM535_20740 [Limnohabitans sp.]|nr:hypothetical protein [Limnohabitans sp.]
MKITSKSLILVLFAFHSCKTHIDLPLNIENNDTLQKPSTTVLNDYTPDLPDYRIVDTIENGNKVTIQYRKNMKIKKSGNLTSIQKNGILISQSNDTIISGEKKTYNKEINDNETILTIYDKINPIKDYDFIYRYKKNLLTSKTVVTMKKNNVLKETKFFFNNNGQIISKIERNHYAKKYPKDNQNGEITYYYKKGRIYQWSKLKHIESKQFEKSGIIRYEELSYYDLKNRLLKKEFLEDISGTQLEVFKDENVKFIQKVKLLKTEYYKNGKLIKTVENKTD